ncbi:hypothetical protein F5Y10DRAFT_270240 [Nemania abortiva]|nr:hypothetical protein F5Y10DRAFT_270240 [Nemania abortiva]
MSFMPIAFDPDLPDISTGQRIVIANAVFTALIILSTGTRIASRIYSKAPFGIDNYMIVLGLTNLTSAFNIATNVLEIQSVHNGFGRHLQFLTDAQARTVRKYSEYSILLAQLSLWSIKISVSFFILALIKYTHNRSRWILYGLITVTTVGNFIQGIFWGTQAKPLEKLWNPEIPGTYASTTTLVVSTSIFTALFSITDLFYALAPIYFFGRLQMDLKKKLIIFGLTGSGLIVFAFSIARVAYIKNSFSPDFSWALSEIYFYNIFERNLAELIADLPAVYPEIRRGCRRLTKQRKTSWPSQQGINNDHHDLRNDSRCAIVTIGSRETRPPKMLEMGEFIKNGEDNQSVDIAHEGVE